jgi:hypothetical protein
MKIELPAPSFKPWKEGPCDCRRRAKFTLSRGSSLRVWSTREYKDAARSVLPISTFPFFMPRPERSGHRWVENKTVIR